MLFYKVCAIRGIAVQQIITIFLQGDQPRAWPRRLWENSRCTNHLKIVIPSKSVKIQEKYEQNQVRNAFFFK